MGVGATLFLLDPVLLMKMSGDSTWTLTARRSDGAIKHYKVVCAGKLSFDWFYFSNHGYNARPLFYATWPRNLTSLMSQLVADADWFAHEGATSQPLH